MSNEYLLEVKGLKKYFNCASFPGLGSLPKATCFSIMEPFDKATIILTSSMPYFTPFSFNFFLTSFIVIFFPSPMGG